MSDPFYASKAWKRLRWKILEAFPACQAPNCREASCRVDHLKSRRLRPDLELEPANMVALCESCHNAKTARVDGGFGNKKKDLKEVLFPGTTADGQPADPRHHWNKAKGPEVVPQPLPAWLKPPQ